MQRARTASGDAMEQRLQHCELIAPGSPDLATAPPTDPELPALSITDLGMIRNVLPRAQGWKVIFTPTYSVAQQLNFYSMKLNCSR